MKFRPDVIVLMVALALMLTINIQAQTKNPPYLSQFPSVERVKAEVKGTDPIDTQARLAQAFSLLNHMIQELAGLRYDQGELSRGEDDLMWEYNKAYLSYTIDAPKPSSQDAPRLEKLDELYSKDPGFLDDLLKRFFSPAFRAGYYRTTKKQPPTSSQTTKPDTTSPSITEVDLGFPTEPTAVLSITNGMPSQGTVKPLNGAPIFLLKDSFDSLLRKTGLFEGPPGATVKVTPIRIWVTSCSTGSPLCQQIFYEIQGGVAATAKMDASGKVTFPAVPPGAYYVFSSAAINQQPLVWDLRVNLKSGANSATLDPNNIRPIDASQAQAGAKLLAESQCQVSDTPVKVVGTANSGLSISGSGYIFKVVNNKTGEVIRTERGNFSNTRFFLLDDDIENIWRNAGVRPFMGMSLMDSVSFYANLSDPNLLKDNPVGKLAEFIGEGLGADAMPKAFQALARAQFACAVKARKAHTITETTTNTSAKGVFPKVPAGTYYLFGQFTGGHPLIWNLKVGLKPGQNTLTISPDNAGWKFGAQ